MKFKLIDRDFEMELPNVKTIGIMVSGGLDSATLLYLLAKEIKDTNKDTTLKVFCVPRSTDGFDSHVLNIINFVNNAIGNSIAEYVVHGETDMHHSSIVYSAYFDILERNLADCIFLGDTANPNVSLPGIDIESYPKRRRDQRPTVHQPFLDYSKDYVIAICKMFMLDDLVKLTHSCTVYKDKRCNTCFQCKEREWAFECNGYVDKGSI